MGDFLYYCIFIVYSFCIIGVCWGGRILLKWVGSFFNSECFFFFSREVYFSFFFVFFECYILRFIFIDFIIWSSVFRWVVFFFDGGFFLLFVWFGERLYIIWFKLCFIFFNNCIIWVFSDNNIIFYFNL